MMTHFRQFASRARSWFLRGHLERDMAEEIESHLHRRVEENLAAGMDPDDARSAAQRQFGAVEPLKERCRDEQRSAWLEQGAQDVRFVLRSLRKAPGFVTTATMVLALGIGASTALFSVINAVLWQSLPFADPDRLVWLGGVLRDQTAEAGVTPADFNDYREQTSSFANLAASVSDGVPVSLTGSGEPARLSAGQVTANFMETLGAPAMLGRTFGPEEGREGSDRVVVLSHALWVERFGAAPAVVGRTLTLDGRTRTIIGVMPPRFQYPAGVALWIPISFTDPQPSLNRSRQYHILRPVGRLKPGVTPTQAEGELDRITQRNAARFPQTNAGWSVRLHSLREHIVGGIRPTLRLTLAAVGCVLLIACANVANLLLARGAVRRRELGVRAALGASRGRLVRQLLTENVVLALLGGVGGVILAIWGMRLLLALGADYIPRASEVAVNWPVLAFALALAVTTGLLCGLIPAVDASRLDLAEAMGEGGRAASGSLRRQRLLRLLVAAELALAVVLLVAAGLLTKSLLRLERVEPGFAANQLLTLRIDLPNPYAEPDKKTAFFEELERRAAALPGIEAVGMVSELPFTNQSADAPFTVEGRAENTTDGQGHADIRTVNEGYFRAMRIPLLHGRGFSQEEVHRSARVAIVSELLARKCFPGRDPIGQRLRFTALGQEPYEIIGVVGDVRHQGFQADPAPTFYYPSLRLGYTNVVIRTAVEPAGLIANLRRAIAAFAPDQPIAQIKPMGQWLVESAAVPRFRAWLIGAFALASGVIALVGLYGVTAYTVAQRTNEFGVRLALGASADDLRRLVLRQGTHMIVTGLVIGLLAALAMTRLLGSLLFGVVPTDPIVFVGIALALATAGLVACYAPARRASRVDPLVALRHE